MFRGMKLRQLEVISVNDAQRLGYVRDVDIDEGTGHVTALIVPKGRTFCERLWHRGEYVIPWSSIVSAGNDLILVRLHDERIPEHAKKEADQ